MDDERMVSVTDDDYEPLEEEISEHVVPESVTLPSGETLDIEAVDRFLRRRSAKLVSIVGERESGKTTLICSLYDRFCHGPFGGYLFAGSASLMAFERRLHYARAASGRAIPDTPRTSISEGLRFFHLGLTDVDNPSNRHDVMLSDRAGEAYRQARNVSDMMEEFIEIEKSEVVVLLIDGGRLADRVERTPALEIARQSLRSFLDSGRLGNQSEVQIVVTKNDLLDLHPDRDAIRGRILSFQERLTHSFEPRLKRLSFWEVAARDPTGRLPLCWGVDTLLQSWLAPETRSRSKRTLPSVRLTTEFDLLLKRTKIEALP